jgi:hypothetical protein
MKMESRWFGKVKVMSDLISRQAAIELIERMKSFHQDADDILEMVDNMPSAEPVRHGKWIGYAGTIGNECSVCGKWIDVLQGTAEMNYCPNCGARMDQE